MPCCLKATNSELHNGMSYQDNSYFVSIIQHSEVIHTKEKNINTQEVKWHLKGLRFINKEKFGRNAYLERCYYSIAYQILKIRLNMENINCNFKASTTICYVISAKGKKRQWSMHYYAPRLREIQFIQKD